MSMTQGTPVRIAEGEPFYRNPAEYTIKTEEGPWRYRDWVIYSAGWRSSPCSLDLFYALFAARINYQTGEIERRGPGLYVSLPGGSGRINWGELMDTDRRPDQGWFPGDLTGPEQTGWRKTAERGQLYRMARLIDEVEDAKETQEKA